MVKKRKYYCIFSTDAGTDFVPAELRTSSRQEWQHARTPDFKWAGYRTVFLCLDNMISPF